MFWLSVATLAAAIVPLDIFDAFNAVKFAPLIAGSVDGKRASGNVPEFKFEADPALKPADVPELVI